MVGSQPHHRQGELSEERKAQSAETRQTFEKLLANATALADVLNQVGCLARDCREL
jgi:hypothetical protein